MRLQPTTLVGVSRDEIHLLLLMMILVVLTLTRIIKSVVSGQAPVTLELRNTPEKKHKQTKGGTRIDYITAADAFHVSARKIKSEIRSQPN